MRLARPKQLGHESIIEAVIEHFGATQRQGNTDGERRPNLPRPVDRTRHFLAMLLMPVRQELAQPRAGAIDLSLEGHYAHTSERRDLWVGQLLDVLEDERLAIDRIDLIEGALGFGPPVCVGWSRRGAYRLRFARQPALAHCSAKGPCPALIDDDAEEPVAELIRLLRPGQGLKSPNESGLQRFVGGIVGAEHANGVARMDIAIATDQGRERGNLSFRRRGDEVAIGVGGHAIGTDHAPVKVTGKGLVAYGSRQPSGLSARYRRETG